jgi:type IV secretory pathway VirB3-like protein
MLVALHYKALVRSRLVAGIGLKSSIVIWGCAMLGLLLLGWPNGLVVVVAAAAIHVVLIWAFKKDHKIIEVMKLYDLLNAHYSGSTFWSDTGLVGRPKGFGKNHPC